MAKVVEVAESSFVRFSDAELKMFEKLIREKLAETKEAIKLLRWACKNPNGTDDTGKSNIVDERAQNLASEDENDLLIIHNQKFERDLKFALVRVHNKNFGICRITGKRIPKERLLLCLIATTCVDAKKEEDLLKKNCRY